VVFAVDVKGEARILRSAIKRSNAAGAFEAGIPVASEPGSDAEVETSDEALW